jgi:hypothetical protein
MGQIISSKPNIVGEVSVKPGMIGKINTKPNMVGVKDKTEVYLVDKTILKGSPMGLLLTLTYPSQLDFTTVRE